MEWQDVEIKQESQAYIPEPGERIMTLNGVETAHANTVVVQHRATENDSWQVFVTDRETFDSRYNHDLFEDNDEGDENAENQEVADAFPVSDENGDSESENPTEFNESTGNGEDSVESDYNEYTVAELKEMLTARELETSGNKPELVARLEEHDRPGANES